MHSRWYTYILKMTFEKTCFFDVGPKFFDRERADFFLFFFLHLSLSAIRHLYSHTRAHTRTPPHETGHRQLFRPFAKLLHAYVMCRYAAAAAVYKKKNCNCMYNTCSVSPLAKTHLPTATCRTTNINSIVLKPYYYNAHTNFTSARAVYSTSYVSLYTRTPANLL